MIDLFICKTSQEWQKNLKTWAHAHSRGPNEESWNFSGDRMRNFSILKNLFRVACEDFFLSNGKKSAQLFAEKRQKKRWSGGKYFFISSEFLNYEYMTKWKFFRRIFIIHRSSWNIYQIICVRENCSFKLRLKLCSMIFFHSLHRWITDSRVVIL